MARRTRQRKPRRNSRRDERPGPDPVGTPRRSTWPPAPESRENRTAGVLAVVLTSGLVSGGVSPCGVDGEAVRRVHDPAQPHLVGAVGDADGSARLMDTASRRRKSHRDHEASGCDSHDRSPLRHVTQTRGRTTTFPHADVGVAEPMSGRPGGAQAPAQKRAPGALGARRWPAAASATGSGAKLMPDRRNSSSITSICEASVVGS